MDKNFKSHKNIQNTSEEMISYLTNLQHYFAEYLITVYYFKEQLIL